MSLEGEPDDRAPPAASGSWPRASWTRSEGFAQYRRTEQRAVRHEIGAASWVPGELPPLLAAETGAARKAANLKEIGRGSFAQHTRHLGNFIRGSLWVGVADRKGQAGLAEFWKPFRGRRDLRDRGHCTFLWLCLAERESVS